MDNVEVTRGITQVDINTEMREAYLQYSMSVIVGRALPDVRDGLKPVHRRILYAMYELNNTHDKPYKKSARVVGDVIGKYHPHGDAAAYDSMVRMAQDFSLRYPLVDGQGNFGSIDGDSPAAHRYTEVRMTRLAEELLEDIEKETVDFSPNYDDSLLIPTVLPAKFPNLLVNGSSGIAVGMATNIPPHNLGEIIDGCVELIENPKTSLDRLIELIPGPDFPSAGIVAGRSGIVSAYKTGKGVITLKAVAEIEVVRDREVIVVTEIPYQVNKARLIENMANLVRDKKIEGISDIRDESSREGMRIVISLKRGENASVTLNRLYKYTQMQVSFGIIMLALDRTQPRVFNLKEVLSSFIAHRKDVVTKRCIFELSKAEARAHILEGLKKALDLIDEVIKTIRASKEAATAKLALISQFDFSDKQAQAILDMRLNRLTGLEKQKIVDELDEVNKRIAWLNMVLADVSEVNKIIVGELKAIKELYSDPRRTRIEGSANEIDDEDLITDEDVIVTYTNTGYVKRISVSEYRNQKRGGKGLKGMETRDEDYVVSIFSATTKTTLLVFTDKGKIYWLKVHRLPQGTRTSKGKAIHNVVNLSKGETVKVIRPVEEFVDDKFVVMITRKGIIKKSSLSLFSNPRPSGIIALTTDLDDELISAKISSGKDDVFIATQHGMSIRFDESDVRQMGRSARGVKGITLGKDDFVVGMDIISKEDKSASILMITEKGYGKRTPVEEYRVQSRGGVGVITQKTTEKVGPVVETRMVQDYFDVIVATDRGQVMRTRCSEISVLGRNTQGVRVMNLNPEETVVGIAIIDDREGSEDSEDSKDVAKSES
jgi:DNA gyrase subunit A